ncbi:MAG: hypothetical protein ABL986_08040 [Vicinamibacterales bacterium]
MSSWPQEFADFEKTEHQRKVRDLKARREKNAQDALRVARLVEGYDRAGHHPHIHKPNDDLVEPMRVTKIAGLIGGAIFTTLVTEQYLSDPSLAVILTAWVLFGCLSRVAEGTMCAALPLPDRLKAGNRLVVYCATLTAIPLCLWLLMRLPATPLAGLADRWEGVALMGTEIGLALVAATAAAAERGFRWSRDYTAIEDDLRSQLIALGEETSEVVQPFQLQPSVTVD